MSSKKLTMVSAAPPPPASSRSVCLSRQVTRRAGAAPLARPFNGRTAQRQHRPQPHPGWAGESRRPPSCQRATCIRLGSLRGVLLQPHGGAPHPALQVRGCTCRTQGSGCLLSPPLAPPLRSSLTIEGESVQLGWKLPALLLAPLWYERAPVSCCSSAVVLCVPVIIMCMPLAGSFSRRACCRCSSPRGSQRRLAPRGACYSSTHWCTRRPSRVARGPPCSPQC